MAGDASRWVSDKELYTTYYALVIHIVVRVHAVRELCPFHRSSVSFRLSKKQKKYLKTASFYMWLLQPACTPDTKFSTIKIFHFATDW